MEDSCEAAQAIAQELLDITGQAIRVGDFATFSSCFTIPQLVETFEGQRILKTPGELQIAFEAVRAHHSRSGITEMVRHCVTAAFKDHETIDTVHETRLVSGSVMAQAPYPAFSVLKFNGQKWQVSKCAYAIPDSERHNKALMGLANPLPKDQFKSA